MHGVSLAAILAAQSAASGGSSGGGGGSTAILMPFDSADPGNNEGDIGQPTITGSPNYSTTGKFGNGLAGGDPITYEQAGLNFHNREWTIESWIYRGRDGQQPEFFEMWAGSDNVFRIKGPNWGGGISWGLSSTGLNELTLAGGTASVDVWHHVALARDSAGVIRSFFDGVEQDSATFDLHNVGADVRPLVIGAQHYDLFMDDFRVLLDQCEYTANFTPPGEHTI